mgnify:FL=1
MRKLSLIKLFLLTAAIMMPVGCGMVSQSTPTTTSTQNSNSDIDISYNRRTPFVPLDNPVFLPAEESSNFPDDEIVLTLEWGGESRAYPLRMLWFHHIVNDTIAGRPFLITF